MKNTNERRKLILFTKNAHFTFDEEIQIQVDCVLIGLPLGSVLPDVFMATSRRYLVSKLEIHGKIWKCFVDKSLSFVEIGYAEYAILELNNFHSNTKGRKR